MDWNSFKIAAAILCGLTVAGSASAQESSNQLEGRVLSHGSPITGSTVTLWAASSKEPENLAQTKTDTDGRFTISIPHSPDADRSLYLIAQGGQTTANGGGGDNPAITLMTVLDSEPAVNVVINEMTTGRRYVFRTFVRRGAFDPLRRSGCDDLFRHGQAGGGASDGPARAR